jgi:glycosyltransferase involved in cell wall biosynthesis
VSTSDYSLCAFTTKVVKLCRMLRAHDHDVFHYGHEDSVVDCTEHVTVTTRADIARTYGDAFDWRKDGLPPFRSNDHVNLTFLRRSIGEIARRCVPGDFLLCMWGGGHRMVADAFPDLKVVEPGIGYPRGHFAPFKVFESYALLHAYLGLDHVASAFNNRWYEVVIPNYFDPGEFEFRHDKGDYLLFLGRIGSGKGTHIAIQIAEATGAKLIVAGPGEIDQSMARTERPIAEYVEHVGIVDVGRRRELLSRARAVIAPTTFLEPFNGVHVEAMMSGTPVITTDFGAFAEYNLHGITGYRCRTFEQFTWAARNIGTIQPGACRYWATKNFSMERVAKMYEEFWWQADKAQWYEPRPDRKELDWLTREYPAVW